MSTLGLRLIFYFTHLCEDAELCHLRRNSSALLPILKGAPGHSKFHGRFFSRPRMSRPPVKQNMRKVYPRRKQFRTLLPSPTVPGPRRTRSSAGGLRHLTLRDRITPLLSRSCRPRPHPRSRFTETPPYLPSRGPQTQRAAHPGDRQNSISPSTATRSAKSTLTTSSCAPERCAPASAFPTSLCLRRKPGRLTPPTTSASTRTNPT